MNQFPNSIKLALIAIGMAIMTLNEEPGVADGRMSLAFVVFWILAIVATCADD